MKFNLTIEIEAKNNPKEWNLQALESEILEQSREASRQLFAEMLGVYEKKVLAFRPPHWTLKDINSKKLSTLFGKMDFERYRIWDSKEKRSRYPLDEALGLKKWGKETSSFKNEVIQQVVKRSYRQSSDEILKQTGVALSKMSTWQLIQKESRKQQNKKSPPMRWRNLALPEPPKLGTVDPCPAMGIDLDGTYCRSWKTKKWLKDHEVKVAVLYRHKVQVGKKRWLLKDKTIIASGPGERLKDFLERVTEQAVVHYGLHDNTKVVVHGDGDPWIRRYAEQYFPSALYRLDPWHIFKKMREKTGLKKLPKSWIEAIYGHPDRLIGELKSFQIQFPKETEDYIKVGELIGYISNNKSGLKPSNVTIETKKKYPRLYRRGSGTIERNIDWTVCQRFKLSRMSWSKKGLDNLLFLRQDYLNGYQKPKYKPIPAHIRNWKSFI
jgi:hypothetical protein